MFVLNIMSLFAPLFLLKNMLFPASLNGYVLPVASVLRFPTTFASAGYQFPNPPLFSIAPLMLVFPFTSRVYNGFTPIPTFNVVVVFSSFSVHPPVEHIPFDSVQTRLSFIHIFAVVPVKFPLPFTVNF